MTPLVGVLLNRHILSKAVRGKSVFERIDLYVEAARELGVNVVFFEVAGVRLPRREVVGYVPTENGTLQRRVVPLPEVVHKRALYYRRQPMETVKRMVRQGVYIFNPPIDFDKYRIHRLLAKEPRLQPYLPDTVLLRSERFGWFQQQLLECGEVFVKPRKGSLGLGIARVVRLDIDRYRYESRNRRRVTSLRGAWSLVRKGRRKHLMQKGIPLIEERGRRFDLRVPVQRDGDGRWQVPGMAAKRAGRLPFLTNLSRGGSAHNGRDLLQRQFGNEQGDEIIRHIKRAAILVAETLNNHYPNMVDLGLDIGVDPQGHPFLIEVNRRDLRYSLLKGGEYEAFRSLYKNPIAYARYIHEQTSL